MTSPRGLRNNNPLNIRHSASRWQGARAKQTDKSFVQFTSLTMGYRAAWRILESYYNYYEKKQTPFTPRNIIQRWAPPTENDSEAYLKAICRLTTLAGNEALMRPSIAKIQSSEQSVQSTKNRVQPPCGLEAESSNPSETAPYPHDDAYTAQDLQAKSKLIDLLAAMTCIENGIAMADVDRDAIEEALTRAFKD